MRPETKSVRLELIRMDGGTQTRAALNDDAVAEYSEAMLDGAKFPPVILFHDGSAYWLADGFHRCHACKASGFLDVLAEVHFGTRREAIKHAIQANQTGSVRRTNADKRKCVEIALENFADLSDRAIADLCGVHHAFVAKNRPQVDTVSTSDPQEPQTRRGKDGKEYPAPAPKQEEPEQEEESNDDSELKPILPEESAKHGKMPRVVIDIADNIASNAISILKTIHPKDTKRTQALIDVISYCNQQLNKK